MNETLLQYELQKAIGAHGAWKLKLSTAIATGHSPVTPDELACYSCCPFGKWLAGDEIDVATRAGKPFQVVSRLHREFHQTAGDVLAKALAGDETGARAVFDSAYKQKSQDLAAALTKWRTEIKRSVIRERQHTG